MDCVDDHFMQIATFFSFILIFSSFILYYFSYKNNGSPTNWPLIGMIPNLLSNLHRIQDLVVDILQQNQGNFVIKGPWFSELELLITADPNNVRYILCERHDAFHKGSNLNQILEVLGDGIFNADSDKWEYQRKIATSYFARTSFHRAMGEIINKKLERNLNPIFERCHKQSVVVDLQDIFHRLSIDIIYKTIIGHDPKELSLDLPNQLLHKKTYDIEEALVLRHILPTYVWKLQNWLRIGQERKHIEAKKFIYDLFYKILGEKREEAKQGMQRENDDLIGFYIQQEYGTRDRGFKSIDTFLRDTFMVFLLAGNNTMATALTCLFWLLIEYPQVEAKIKDELTKHFTNDFAHEFDAYQLAKSKGLVYLHATILEALRLYPPLPFNPKASKKRETLPSGHRVSPHTMIVISSYATGRMKSVWGEDCNEFKPERWITEQGTIKYVPSHKFNGFGAGPRLCLGRELTLVQLKAVVVHVLHHNYRFELVEGHRVEFTPTVVLKMKHGLKVKVTKNA